MFEFLCAYLRGAWISSYTERASLFFSTPRPRHESMQHPCHLPTFLTTLNILGVEEDVRPGGRDIILSGLGRCHELILEVALSLSRPFKKFHPSIRSYYVPSESCLLFLLLTNHQRSSRNPTRATTLCLHNIYSISSYHSFSVCQCTVLYLFMMSLLFFPFPIAFHCSFTRYVILHRHSIIIPPS